MDFKHLPKVFWASWLLNLDPRSLVDLFSSRANWASKFPSVYRYGSHPWLPKGNLWPTLSVALGSFQLVRELRPHRSNMVKLPVLQKPSATPIPWGILGQVILLVPTALSCCFFMGVLSGVFLQDHLGNVRLFTVTAWIKYSHSKTKRFGPQDISK